MRERGVSFKQAVNDAIRAGAATSAADVRFRTETTSMGEPVINLDRALQVSAELEDDDLVRRMRAGS
jgi:hypothetical protein